MSRPRPKRRDDLHVVLRLGVDVGVHGVEAGLGRDEAAAHHGEDLDEGDGGGGAGGVEREGGAVSSVREGPVQPK